MGNNQIWYNKQSYLIHEYMSMTWGWSLEAGMWIRSVISIYCRVPFLQMRPVKGCLGRVTAAE